MKKILLPVDFPYTSMGIVHQAAFLARHYQAQIVLLHVVTSLSYPAGFLESGHELTAKDLHAQVFQRVQKAMDDLLRPELDGIEVQRLILRGDPAKEISAAARSENIDLIALSTHGFAAVYRFLLGSTAAKVLHDSDCAVWTTHADDPTQPPPPATFAVRNVLCAVDLSVHSRNTVAQAAKFAADFGAKLTLAHVTAGVEMFGPGGSYVVPQWKNELVGYATKEIAQIQKELGINADVIIESGDYHKLLNQAAKQTKSDVVIIGHLPAGGHLGENGSGYGMIRESRIPVLSV